MAQPIPHRGAGRLERVRTAARGVIGVGRIGRMHAELLARQVPGAALAAVHDADADAPRAVARPARRAVAAGVDEVLAAPDVDAVAICTSTDTHADLIAAARAAPARRSSARSRSRSTSPRSTARWPPSRRAGVPFQIGFNRRFDPAHRSVRDAVAGGSVGEPAPRCGSPAATRRRRRSSTSRVSGGIFLDMTSTTSTWRASSSAARSSRSSPAARCASTPRSARRRPRHRRRHATHDNGCLTVIDNSRQAVYGYDQRVEAFGSAGMAASENPLAHTGVRPRPRTARAARRCRTSSSTATSRATSGSGRRSSRRSAPATLRR